MCPSGQTHVVLERTWDIRMAMLGLESGKLLHPIIERFYMLSVSAVPSKSQLIESRYSRWGQDASVVLLFVVLILVLSHLLHESAKFGVVFASLLHVAMSVDFLKLNEFIEFFLPHRFPSSASYGDPRLFVRSVRSGRGEGIKSFKTLGLNRILVVRLTVILVFLNQFKILIGVGLPRRTANALAQTRRRVELSCRAHFVIEDCLLSFESGLGVQSGRRSAVPCITSG
mmetsp:Transcript_2976/g.6724  ORF Transcript_2976/g.6724 Transcript_2976/m.6724 type:complete len:228 (+) Transcript_2976:722-1405(+)